MAKANAKKIKRVTLYPSLEEALYLHSELIQRFGGMPGIRDQGLLESALHRPQSGYYKSLSEQAASLLQSLCQNHSFVDGNKRVAFALTAVFLRMNGFRLKVDADNGETFMIARVIKARAELSEIRDWLEKNMIRV
jgi:death-on-curing protein